MNIKDRFIEWYILRQIGKLKKEGKMGKISAWVKENNLYIAAVIVGITAGLQYVGISIPEWAYTILAALGITVVKSTINNEVAKLARK